MTGGPSCQARQVVLSLPCFLLLLLCPGSLGKAFGNHCSLFSGRELYSQFLREMIIQPGIAKANMGASREDVTFEDHVSRGRHRGLRLQNEERCELCSRQRPPPQRTSAAGLGPL